MNDPDVLTCAVQAGEWFFDRRERLEKHEQELTALLWLSVSEIQAIIDSFDALEAVHGLTVDERACYATISLTGSEGAVSREARDARRAVRPPADADALLSPEQVACRCGLSRRAVYRAVERGEPAAKDEISRGEF